MYALNVHSCCRLVIDVHILVSPNDGCPCMWSGVVRQSNLDSALREVPYNSLRRTTDRHGRPPPRLITRAQLLASLAFPWLKTCTTADEYYACIFLMTSRTGKSYILARCRIYVPMLINRIVVPQGKHGNEAREMHDCSFFLWAPRLYQYGHASHLLYINMKRDKHKH